MARIIEQKMNKAISSGQNFSSGNTTVITQGEGEIVVVLLHGNLIAEFYGGTLRIFDGGWQSKTTKGRLNAILQPLGWGIFQKDYEWFVNYNGENVPFESGMILQYIH
jgi:hypothetical protein